ncbi:hypothetical protein HW555_010036 [Spodoptera exigua]|uniref:Uncharacterized protein n=1 Tax=Spodoptera exigua TaxID=7107 RepID=A0A835GBW7_SPOEX|nr:hypothetical protein HW555_010036 [Spodoptera exigua]
MRENGSTNGWPLVLINRCYECHWYWKASKSKDRSYLYALTGMVSAEYEAELNTSWTTEVSAKSTVARLNYLIDKEEYGNRAGFEGGRRFIIGTFNFGWFAARICIFPLFGASSEKLEFYTF